MSWATIGSYVSISFIVSVITSIVVSTTAFILGVRMAKNQSDRSALRETYKTLYEHLDNIKGSIENREPIHWGKFRYEKNWRNTPVRAIVSSGQSNMIPQHLMERIMKVENDALSIAGGHSMWVEENFADAAINYLDKAGIKAGIHSSGRSIYSYTGISFTLIDEERLSKFETDAIENQIGISLGVKPKVGSHQTYYIYPDKLEIDAFAKLISDLHSIMSDDEEGRKLIDGLNDQPEKLVRMLNILRSRIRDPHPLYESIAQSFRDIFGRK